jgi:trehalose utilization protein
MEATVLFVQQGTVEYCGTTYRRGAGNTLYIHQVRTSWAQAEIEKFHPIIFEAIPQFGAYRRAILSS